MASTRAGALVFGRDEEKSGRRSAIFAELRISIQSRSVSTTWKTQALRWGWKQRDGFRASAKRCRCQALSVPSAGAI